MPEKVTELADDASVVFANGVHAETPAGMITP
jgi:hypothetical protein